MRQRQVWLRPGVFLFLLGAAVCLVAIVPELLLAEFLLTGGQLGSLVLTVTNRLIAMATIFGSALCAGGVVLEVRRWMGRRDGADGESP